MLTGVSIISSSSSSGGGGGDVCASNAVFCSTLVQPLWHSRLDWLANVVAALCRRSNCVTDLVYSEAMYQLAKCSMVKTCRLYYGVLFAANAYGWQYLDQHFAVSFSTLFFGKSQRDMYRKWLRHATDVSAWLYGLGVKLCSMVSIPPPEALCACASYWSLIDGLGRLDFKHLVITYKVRFYKKLAHGANSVISDLFYVHMMDKLILWLNV